MIEDEAGRAAATALPRLLTDAELAPLIRLSVGFLQRDRCSAKRIPFVRIGDRVLYDPVAVADAIRGMAQGGSVVRARRKVAA